MAASPEIAIRSQSG